ncbi:MAG: acyl-CoA thioesterase [Crocinitomicaceae bacterium]|jgi:acyl-CoA thioester hydrolase
MIIKNFVISPRFKDCDIMGHVNNSVYLTYIEEARIFFFNQLISEDWDWRKNGIIIKKHEITYDEPLFLGDNIEIESKLGKINNSSFELHHKIMMNNKIKSTAISVLVYFDYITKKPKKLDEKILQILKSC